jgi:protein-L-isoaspartate(D-aspartate) O-methyltransferase
MAMIDPAAARLNMVDSQLRTNKVTDEAVLQGFLAVPRERFVPEALRGTAYVDEDIPLGGGRFLMEPMVLARLLQLARLEPTDAVLEVGCATGYATALLARLAQRVTAVEADRRLAQEARARLAELALANATVVEGPLAVGHAAGAPYAVILLNGAVAFLPPAIADQLAEGGRLVTVLRPPGQVGQATLMTKANGVISRRPVFDAATPLLPGFQAEPSFVF